MRDLVSLNDMSRTWWDGLFSRCCDIITNPGKYAESCRGKILATLFYEPSTRTCFSFQTAALRLGADVIGFSGTQGTSATKGETLADTIRIVSSYTDTIVIRSAEEGAAQAAMMYSGVPVINAGDGSHLHPTQTLTDLTTIARKRGEIANFKIGLCGDLKYGRTVHSLIMALAIFPGISFYLISPPELRIPDYMREFMNGHGLQYVELESINQCVGELDILYMTRIQRERFGDLAEYERLRGSCVLTKELMACANRNMLVMHPLPRREEIPPEIDADPRAVYFKQARYGMFIRMALLYDFLHREYIEAAPQTQFGGHVCRNEKCVTKTETYLPPLLSGLRCGYCEKKM